MISDAHPSNAEPSAARALFGALYAELRVLAQRHLGKHHRSLTLGPTTLLHETFLRMASPGVPAFSEPPLFFAYASRVMRTLAIDHVRSRRAYKRSRHLAITLPGDEASRGLEHETGLDLLKLNAALEELAMLDTKLAELVELHFFGGLTFVEIASLRDVSERTVQRDWHKARLLLHQCMSDP